MILFWSLLVLAVLVVLWILLRPLLGLARRAVNDEYSLHLAVYRDNLRELEEEYGKGRLDEAQWRNARHELERSLLGEIDVVEETGTTPARPGRDSRAAVFAAVLVVTLASLLYGLLGNPQLNRLEQLARWADTEADAAAPLADMVAPLEMHLQRNPADGNALLLLARLYLAQEDYDLAVAAFERLYRLSGDVPDVMMAYVDALVRANSGSFQGKASELIQRVLSLEPDNNTALFFAGLAADEAGDYAVANDYYRKILPVLENNPQMSRTVNALIERNRQLMAGAGEAPDPDTGAVATDAPDKSVSLTVRVDEGLKDRFGPEDTLFVYAQAPGGSPPMPLAVVRTSAGKLPLEVTLDDSMAMMPALRLSAYETVRIQARISRSGDASAQPGDLVGILPEVKVAGADMLELTIDEVVTADGP